MLDLPACWLSLCLSLSLASQAPPEPARGGSAEAIPEFPGKPVAGRKSGTERWIVHFKTRSFDLSALEAEYHGAKNPARVAALCADLEVQMRTDQAPFCARVEALGALVFLQYWLVNACVIEIEPRKLPAVRALRNVRFLQPDVAVMPQIKDATNSSNHDADAVQAAGYGGFGVSCAILDTGQDSNMANTNKPHITYSVLGNGSVTRLLANIQIGSMPPDDVNGHGTGVASIAAGWKWNNAAADSGHAHLAGIVGYAIANTTAGTSTIATMAAAYQAVTADAATYRIVTTNLSYGGSPNALSLEQIAMDTAANTADLLNCTAAGNSGDTVFSLLNLNGLSVGACDNGGVKTVASFSSRGLINNTMPFPAMCANGVNTVMALRDDETLNSVGSGSSLASPQVCGAATTLRARFPAMTGPEARAILLASCLPSPGTGLNQVSSGPGCGYLHDPSAHALAATGRFGSGRFAGPGLFTTPMNVQAGKAYQAVVVWPRADPSGAAFSDLDLEILDGTQVIYASKHPVSTLEFCRFYTTKTTTLSMVVRTVALSAPKQPFSWAWGEAQPAFQPGSHVAFGQGCAGTGQPSVPGQVRRRVLRALPLPDGISSVLMMAAEPGKPDSPAPFPLMKLLPAALLASVIFVASAVLSLAGGKTGHGTTLPTVVSVEGDKLTVKTGVHAGLKSTAHDAGEEVPGASNIETYRIMPGATVTVNGLKATLADIQPGMRAFVTMGLDRGSAASIAATVLPPPPPKPTPRPGHEAAGQKDKGPVRLFSGIDPYLITALGAESITVSQKGGSKTMTFKLGKFTTIMVNDKAAKVGALKVGMKATVAAGLDPAIAGRITAFDE